MSNQVYGPVRQLLTGNLNDTRVDYFVNAVDDFVRANHNAPLQQLLSNDNLGYFTSRYFKGAANDTMFHPEFVNFLKDMALWTRRHSNAADSNWGSVQKGVHRNIVQIIFRHIQNHAGLVGGRPTVDPSQRQAFDIFVEYLNSPSETVQSSDDSFNLDLPKIISELAKDRSAGASPAVVDTLSWFKNLENENTTPEDLIFRKADGKLYRKDANGQVVPIPPEIFHNNPSSDCNSTGLTFGNDTDCGMYFMNLLTGKNIEQAAAYINNQSQFYNGLKSIPERMHPDTATRTLDGLGVKIGKGVVNGQEVRVYESRQNWLQRLRSSGQVNISVLETDKVKDYVDAVIKFVNTNPGILNSNYTGSPVSQFPEGPTAIVSRFNNVGDGVPNVRYVPYIPNTVRVGDISRIQSNINLRRANTAVAWGLPTVPAVLGLRPQFMSVMRGGAGEGLVSKIMNDEYKVETKTNRTSSLLRQIHRSLEGQLNSRQKQLDGENKSQIEKLFASLENAENSLFKVLNIIDQYASGSAINQDPSNNLNLPQLEELIKKRNKLFTKIVLRENQIIPIELTIASSMDDLLSLIHI